MGPSLGGFSATINALNSEHPTLKEIKILYLFEIDACLSLKKKRKHKTSNHPNCIISLKKRYDVNLELDLRFQIIKILLRFFLSADRSRLPAVSPTSVCGGGRDFADRMR